MADRWPVVPLLPPTRPRAGKRRVAPSLTGLAQQGQAGGKGSRASAPGHQLAPLPFRNRDLSAPVVGPPAGNVHQDAVVSQ